MSTAHGKFLVAGVLLVGAATYLGFGIASSSGWVYLVDVDTFVAERGGSGRARVHGTVGAEGVDLQPAKLLARFTLLGSDSSLRVVFRGAIPDHFEAGREVVVEGRIDEAGVFQADVLMTKCASKYEERPGRDGSG